MTKDEKLQLAEEAIANLVQHDGAEGFSQSTYALLERWNSAVVDETEDAHFAPKSKLAEVDYAEIERRVLGLGDDCGNQYAGGQDF